jgi:hypothetical protein
VGASCAIPLRWLPVVMAAAMAAALAVGIALVVTHQSPLRAPNAEVLERTLAQAHLHPTDDRVLCAHLVASANEHPECQREIEFQEASFPAAQSRLATVVHALLARGWRSACRTYISTSGVRISPLVTPDGTGGLIAYVDRNADVRLTFTRPPGPPDCGQSAG